MKKLWMTLTLALIAAQAQTATAQDEAAPEAPAAAESSEGGLGGAGSVQDSFGDIGFKSIEALQMSFNADGSKSFDGEVELLSERMDLICRELKVNEDKIVAKGSPVKIRQDNVKAECGTFNYDMKTKNSTLEGSPVIYEQREDGTIKTTAGRIFLKQTDGGTNVILDNSPGAKPKITKVESPSAKSKAPANNGKKPPQKPKTSESILPDIKTPSKD